MPVTYVIRYEVLPAGVDRFLSLFDDVLDAMREEPEFHEAMRATRVGLFSASGHSTEFNPHGFRHR